MLHKFFCKNRIWTVFHVVGVIDGELLYNHLKQAIDFSDHVG